MLAFLTGAGCLWEEPARGDPGVAAAGAGEDCLLFGDPVSLASLETPGVDCLLPASATSFIGDAGAGASFSFGEGGVGASFTLGEAGGVASPFLGGGAASAVFSGNGTGAALTLGDAGAAGSFGCGVVVAGTSFFWGGDAAAAFTGCGRGFIMGGPGGSIPAVALCI